VAQADKRRGAAAAGRAASILRWLAFACIVVAVAGLFWLVPAAPTIAVIKATTEFVSYDVVVPDLAQIRLDGYAIWYETADESLLQHGTVSSATARRPLCLSGLLTPTPETRISYHRFGKKPVAIILERTDDQPVASFDQASGEIPGALTKAPWVRLDAPAVDREENSKSNAKASPACPGDPATRLPVYGRQVRIGTELRPASLGNEPSTGLLIEGTIDLFAKTIEIGELWNGATTIYPTSLSSMSIPPGSQISEFVAKGATSTAWSGYAKLDKDEALAVRVTTPATHIAILRPGIGMKPEILSTSLFAQLIHDPTLLSLQVLAALLFSILKTASSALDWYSKRGLVPAADTDTGAEQGKEPVAVPPSAEKTKVP
jgi:hypothetical protein